MFCAFFIRCTTGVTRCHLLPFTVTRCITRCHSLPLVVPLVVTRCTTRCHSLYYSFSLVVPIVVTRCHLLYHFVVTRCLSLSLDVPLVCVFINDRLFWFKYEPVNQIKHIRDEITCDWHRKNDVSTSFVSLHSIYKKGNMTVIRLFPKLTQNLKLCRKVFQAINLNPVILFVIGEAENAVFPRPHAIGYWSKFDYKF